MLVFTVEDGEPLEERVLRRLLERLRVPAVPHGFQSSFRDWAAEETEHRREVIEAALAHVVGNRVEAAYARSDLFERRRRLMNDWAGYLDRTHPQHPAIVGTRQEGLADTVTDARTQPSLVSMGLRPSRSPRPTGPAGSALSLISDRNRGTPR